MTKQSRKSELSSDANAIGLYVRTWSPGDGKTRYRFFVQCVDCNGVNESTEDGAGYCPSCENKTNSYFGPANGIFTALGMKEAETFLSGYNAARR